MSSLNDVSGIPTEGKNLIIVAAVNNVLHFRIFDGDGKVVVDTDEKRLTEQARQIEDLRKQLESLWPPHELTRAKRTGSSPRLHQSSVTVPVAPPRIDRMWRGTPPDVPNGHRAACPTGFMVSQGAQCQTSGGSVSDFVLGPYRACALPICCRCSYARILSACNSL